MGEKVEQIKIKNRTYYFYNDIIDLKKFDSSLLKLDKKHYKGIICLLIMQVDILREKIEINTWFLILQMKPKKY